MFYALDQLDEKMLEYLDYGNGVFVEAGANDGITQSNTCFYEREKNYKFIKQLSGNDDLFVDNLI